METESLYNQLNSITRISEEAWNDFKVLLEPLELKRNEYLVREGSRVSHCYLLNEGVVRVYYNKEGNEYNKMPGTITFIYS